MHNLTKGIISCAVAVIAGACTTGSVAQHSKYAKLVWADEFEVNGLPDNTKWVYDTARGCPNNCGWGNNELQYYTTSKRNAEVKDGLLHINAYREPTGDANFSSARIKSYGKYNLKYGRVDVRAKLPEGVGAWPAAWMLGANIYDKGWPECGEIDIMEYRGYQPDKIFGTFHYPGRSGENADGDSVMIKNASGDFHVYSTEWDADNIKIFVDGNLVHSLANNTNLPFNHDFFIILNMAIGGGFGGPVSKDLVHANYVIDYVRVYQ